MVEFGFRLGSRDVGKCTVEIIRQAKTTVVIVTDHANSMSVRSATPKLATQVCAQLNVDPQKLGSVDICICNRCAGPFHVIPSAGKH